MQLAELAGIAEPWLHPLELRLTNPCSPRLRLGVACLVGIVAVRSRNVNCKK
jgi:hypothetical protein